MARHRAPRKTRRLRSLITTFALVATGLVVASGPASASSLLTGRAAVLAAHGLINLSPVQDTGLVAESGDSFHGGCSLPIQLGTLLAANGLCANVSTGVPPSTLAPSASSTASAANVTIGVPPVPSLPPIPGIALRTVTAASVSSCNGSQTVQKGDVTVGFLQIGTRVVISHLIHPAKNTTINVGLVKVVLNQQNTVAGVLGVTAVHITVAGTLQDIVVAQANSGAFCSSNET